MRAIAEQGMWTAMKEIERKWNVDKENLFAMGNSAGSNSTMYFFLKYPEIFRAAVPTGGFINYHFADMSQIRPGTLLHIIGTEDEYGFDDMIKAYCGIGPARNSIQKDDYRRRKSFTFLDFCGERHF